MLARTLGARVEVVHAYHVPSLLSREAPIVKKLAPTLTEGIRALHALPMIVNVRVEGAPPAKAIVDAARSAEADLVVMASNGRDVASPWLLGGVTDRVIRTSRSPRLGVQEPATSPGGP